MRAPPSNSSPVFLGGWGKCLIRIWQAGRWFSADPFNGGVGSHPVDGPDGETGFPLSQSDTALHLPTITKLWSNTSARTTDYFVSFFAQMG